MSWVPCQKEVLLLESKTTFFNLCSATLMTLNPKPYPKQSLSFLTCPVIFLQFTISGDAKNPEFAAAITTTIGVVLFSTVVRGT
jgi:hypothetical protein